MDKRERKRRKETVLLFVMHVMPYIVPSSYPPNLSDSLDTQRFPEVLETNVELEIRKLLYI